MSKRDKHNWHRSWQCRNIDPRD